MPTDLDEMLDSLGHDADEIPLNDATSVRQRGDYRKRTRLAAMTVAAACVVATGVASTTWLPHLTSDPSPPTTTAAAPGQLDPLKAVGEEVPFGGTTEYATPGISGDRVFVGSWMPGGSVKVTGVDLATGKAAWPTVDAGTAFDGSMTVFPQAVVAELEHQDGRAGPGRTMVVIDPDTGKTRWELPHEEEDDLVFHGFGVIFTKAATGATQALDWGTGRPNWELPADARLADTLTAYRSADLERGFGGGRLSPIATDPRLLQVTKGGELLVRDATTGKLQDTLPGLDAGASYQAFDGKLYGVTGYNTSNKPYRITVTDIEGAGGSRLIHTGPPRGTFFGDMAPCGKDRICVSEHTDRSGFITAIDVTKGRPLWRKPAPASPGAKSEVRGGRILVSGSDGAFDGQETQVSFLYDANGKQMLEDADQRADVEWIDGDTLLSLPAAKGQEVAKVAAKDGARQVIGGQPTSLSPFCVSNATRLACPSATGILIWDLPS